MRDPKSPPPDDDTGAPPNIPPPPPEDCGGGAFFCALPFFAGGSSGSSFLSNCLKKSNCMRGCATHTAPRALSGATTSASPPTSNRARVQPSIALGLIAVAAPRCRRDAPPAHEEQSCGALRLRADDTRTVIYGSESRSLGGYWSTDGTHTSPRPRALSCYVSCIHYLPAPVHASPHPTD